MIIAERLQHPHGQQSPRLDLLKIVGETVLLWPHLSHNFSLRGKKMKSESLMVPAFVSFPTRTASGWEKGWKPTAPGTHAPQTAHRCKQPVRNPATSLTLQNMVMAHNPETVPSGEKRDGDSTCYPGEKKKLTLEHLAWLGMQQRRSKVQDIPFRKEGEKQKIQKKYWHFRHCCLEKDWFALSTWYDSQNLIWLSETERRNNSKHPPHPQGKSKRWEERLERRLEALV